MSEVPNIFTACALNDFETITIFLSDYGNDVNERNDQGLTCLHIAASLGHLETVKVLVDFGADLYVKDVESQWNALHRAIYHNHPKVVMYLVYKAGMKLDTADLPVTTTMTVSSSPTNNTIQNDDKKIRDKEGFTPLDLLSLGLTSNLKCSKVSNTANYVMSYGKADFQLGVPLPKSADVTRPRRIDALLHESIVSVACSKYHSLALSKEGSVFSWGHGRGGRLGQGDEASHLAPMIINSLLTHKVVFLAASENHSLVVTNEGVVFSWGSDRFGQLGHGSTPGSNDTARIVLTPKKIEAFKKEFVLGKEIPHFCA